MIAADGVTHLLRNVGDGTFEDVTSRSGLSDSKAPNQALWTDFDGDGRLDLLLPSYEGATHLFRQTEQQTFDAANEFLTQVFTMEVDDSALTYGPEVSEED